METTIFQIILQLKFVVRERLCDHPVIQHVFAGYFQGAFHLRLVHLVFLIIFLLCKLFFAKN